MGAPCIQALAWHSYIHILAGQLQHFFFLQAVYYNGTTKFSI